MARPTNIRWRVFILIALASFVAYVLRSTMSIGAPAIIEDLGISQIQFGWITSAFLWSYAICQFPGGIFGDKAGPRKALAIIAILWGIGLALTAFVPGKTVASAGTVVGLMIAVRFLNGVAHGPVFPVINVSISRWFPVGSWALPTGLSSSGLTLGSAVSAPLLAWMILEYGWRLSFLILAPLGFVLAGLWWWYARDFPQDHDATNDAEVELIAAKRPPPVLSPINPPGWIRVLKNRDIVLLTASYTFSNYVFYSVFSYFFLYLVTGRQLGDLEAGGLSGQIWLIAAIGAAFGGWLCDHLCRKLGLRWGYRWPIIIGQSGCAVLFVVGAYHADPIIAVAILSVAFCFQQMTEGAYWSSSISIGNQLAGTAGGIMNTGANAMGAVHAVLFIWLADSYSWAFAMASNALFSLLALGLMMLVRTEEPIPLD
jgi:ACS family glucarate transporter-like MFS transporter